MLAAVIILSLLAVGAGIGVAYLLIERSRLQRDLDLTCARGEESERRVAAFAAEVEEAQRALESATAENKASSQRLSDSLVEVATLRERSAAMEREYQRSARELQQRLAEMQEHFKATIDASAASALQKSSELFLKLAEKTFAESREKTNASLDARVKPIDETLKKAGERLGEIERTRVEAQARLEQQIRSLNETGARLTSRTDNLVKALRKPQVRGRYGEIQLERVIELAGMRSYCDFSTQESSRDSEGKLLRPDVVVRLPNGRTLAIDAKTNIEAYLDAIEAESDEEATSHFDRFARHVAEQADALAKKGYAAGNEQVFDFVVMFVPGDQFIDAALQRRPDLLDMAAQSRIILASPSTLIGLLRAVYLGWREKSLSDSANELFELGRELHERAAVTLSHAADVGRAIGQAQERYNRFVGSVEGRLFPTLRKFEERGASSSRKLDDLTPIDGSIRELRSLPSDVGRAQASAEGQPPAVAVRAGSTADVQSLLDQ